MSRETYLYVFIPTRELGLAIAARSQHGLAAILFGGDPATDPSADDPSLLSVALAKEFPEGNLERTSEERGFAAYAKAILNNEPWEHDRPPLDLQGSRFDQRVWLALLEQTNRGERLPYAYLASRTGVGFSAARAVAQACGRNRMAVVVPCHRAVNMDGTAGGYRWGEWRKRTLLDWESRK